MAKKRGLGGARGLDALLGNIKKEKALIEPQAVQSPLQNTPKTHEGEQVALVQMAVT